MISKGQRDNINLEKYILSMLDECLKNESDENTIVQDRILDALGKDKVLVIDDSETEVIEER